MSTMSMNKVIHGAFRRDLDRFTAALATFPAGDGDRARQLGDAWANFDDQLTHHHRGEHAIVWPALQAVGVSTDLLVAMDAEHDVMAAAVAEAREAMSALTRTAGAREAAAALAAFHRLRAATVTHLDHEEAELEGVYLANRDTPEIKAMGRALAKGGPARGGRFLAWVLDGASPEERGAVTAQVPGPVLTVIGGIFGRSYRRNVAPAWKA